MKTPAYAWSNKAPTEIRTHPFEFWWYRRTDGEHPCPPCVIPLGTSEDDRRPRAFPTGTLLAEFPPGGEWAGPIPLPVGTVH